MSLNVVSLFSRAARPRSWSNQELAEFYRVQGSLARAGLAVETDQGYSDEGDPWFVFCRADSGDVIIHFARIDGLYVVASPAFDSCVRGHDFRSLIEGLIEQHPIVMPREKEKGKFFIHPAALLVALVTSAFFKLYQGDALAAEGRDDSHGALLGGVGRGAAATQPHMIALDERAAATLMVAVAVAVAWEQVTTPDAPAPVAHAASEEHLANLPSSSVPAAPTVHANLQESNSGEGRSTSPLDPGQSIVHDSPVMVATPTQTAPQAIPDSAAAPVKQAPEPQHISAPDAPPVMGTTDAGAPAAPSHRTAEASPEHAAPQTSGADQHTSSEATTSSGNSSAAMVELRAVVGDGLQTHMAANATEAPQQQFVLSLINGGQAAPQGTDTIAQAGDSAKVPAGTVSPSMEGAPASAFSASSSAAPPSQVDQAIHEFIFDHADFQIIKLDHEVIMYDPALTPTNARYAEQESFSFADGSSLLLIGLPQHNPATYSYGV